jgi:hypothetical protein
MTIDYRNLYGAQETNGMEPGEQDAWLARLDGEVYWADPSLAKITRLRLLSDPGFPYWDVSYCYGIRKDGTECRVSLPFHQLNKRRWKSEIVEWARKDGIYALGLGLFDPYVVSTLS